MGVMVRTEVHTHFCKHLPTYITSNSLSLTYICVHTNSHSLSYVLYTLTQILTLSYTHTFTHVYSCQHISLPHSFYKTFLYVNTCTIHVRRFALVLCDGETMVLIQGTHLPTCIYALTHSHTHTHTHTHTHSNRATRGASLSVFRYTTQPFALSTLTLLQAWASASGGIKTTMKYAGEQLLIRSIRYLIMSKCPCVYMCVSWGWRKYTDWR